MGTGYPGGVFVYTFVPVGGWVQGRERQVDGFGQSGRIRGLADSRVNRAEDRPARWGAMEIELL